MTAVILTQMISFGDFCFAVTRGILVQGSSNPYDQDQGVLEFWGTFPGLSFCRRFAATKKVVVSYTLL